MALLRWISTLGKAWELGATTGASSFREENSHMEEGMGIDKDYYVHCETLLGVAAEVDALCTCNLVHVIQ